MKNLTTLIIISLLAFTDVIGQINFGGEPTFMVNSESINTTKIQLPAINRETLAAEDAVTDKIKDIPWRFGVEYEVNITPSNQGYWTTEGDENIWRVAITGEDATCISLRFSEFNLEKGSYLFIWSPITHQFIGRFDHRNIKEWGGLATGVIAGPEVIVELHQPVSRGVTAPITIDQAVYGYRNLLSYAEDITAQFRGPFGNSGACNINVNCPEGAPWQTESRSVAIIVQGGYGACTGALINNTSNDGTPYFLTANHCLGNPGNWVFYFNHESATCNGSTGPTNQSVSGATTLVSNGSSDFALLELSSVPPASFNVQYAGFDASGNTPESAVCIHHPGGDVKKICFEDDSPYTTNAAGAAVWFIDQWEDGVTEPGSSGAPLFDHNHRIIGQLYGGSAACNGSVNNGQPDYYGRLNVSWGNGASQYLDPTGGNTTVWDGYPDGAVSYDNDAGVSISGSPEGLICGADPISVDVILSNPGNNNLTSCFITYNFNSSSSQQINWNGNLSTGQTETISLPAFTPVNGTNSIEVSVLNPNGGVDDNTLNNNSETEFSTFAGDTYDFKFVLTLDDYGSETTWNIKRLGTIVYEGGPYEDDLDQEQIEVDMCLEEGCYIVTLYDSYGDGLCCEYGEGSWVVYDDDNNVMVESDGVFEDSETDQFCTEWSSVGMTDAELSIYPNPANDLLTIETPNTEGIFTILDTSGRIITSFNQKNSTTTQIEVSSWAEGLYIVTWTNSEGEISVNQIGITH